jgi:hypothetical protein
MIPGVEFNGTSEKQSTCQSVTCHFQIFIVHCVYLHKNDYFIRHRFRPIVRLYFLDYSDNSIIRQVGFSDVFNPIDLYK